MATSGSAQIAPQEPRDVSVHHSTKAFVVRRRALALGASLYLLGAIGLFWNVLSLSPTRAATCTCSDVSQFAWFQEWPFAALKSAHNPLFTSAMFHPHGINLLANTSATGIGFLMIPITALWGPLASLNLGLILAPSLSALAAMYVARRWCRSELSAFVAGAVYGFSPLVLFHDALGHLNVTFLMLVPLVLACWDDLLVTHRHRARRVALALGVLMTWQFFIGSEVFVLTLFATALCLGTLVVVTFLRDRSTLVTQVAQVAPAVALAVATCALLLAAPVLYALAGPAHYSGPVWPGQNLSTVSLRSFVLSANGPRLWWDPAHAFLPATYVAPSLVVVLVVGAWFLRREPRHLMTLVFAALMAWLALAQHYFFGAWHYLVHLPLAINVVNERFSSFLFLFLALALARTLDAVVEYKSQRASAWLAAAVAVVALAPYLVNAAQVAPYSASKIWIPRWYQQVGAHLGAHQVVLGFPFFDTSANLLAVQATYEMRYAIVGGTTPQWLIERQGEAAPGYRVIWNAASSAQLAVLALRATSAESAALEKALMLWKVTYVVVPMLKGPNTSPVARDPHELERYLASVLGVPKTVAGAWVWHLRDGVVLTR
jgi:hypothetical protein